jgi:hypothetical protein
MKHFCAIYDESVFRIHYNAERSEQKIGVIRSDQ